LTPATPLQQRPRELVEVLGILESVADASQVDPLGNPVEAMTLLAEDALQPGQNRGVVRRDLAALLELAEAKNRVA